ncbi:MAG: PxKF domain-containing protein [Vicinamibacterales bacterium]
MSLFGPHARRQSPRVSRTLASRVTWLAGSLVLAGLASSFLVSANGAASLTPEQSAYAGGDEVMFSAQGFAPFEAVTLRVVHDDGTAEPGMGHEPFTVAADATGSLTDYWTLNPADASGRRFEIHATAASGTSAVGTFERAPRVDPSTRRVVFGRPLTVVGRDFQPGETVTVQVTHDDGTSGPGLGLEPIDAVAEADGTFSLSWTGSVSDAGGPRLTLSATGSVSGAVASIPLRRAGVASTDKADYMPAETAAIHGAGFQPGEVVEVQVVHLTGTPDGNGHTPFFVNADASGAVATNWYVDPDDSLGARFLLTAKGLSSGILADWTFTDAGSANFVISQVYGGGGNSGATFTNDFVQVFNRGASAASLNGLSIQYASATGTGNFGANSGQLTVLPNVTLQPGQYYLVKEASGGSVGTAFTADFTPASLINMSASAGKVALVSSTSSLGCNGGSTPCSATQLASIVDLVGFGNANFSETAAAPTLSATTAATRGGAGCTDTDDNSADFTATTLNASVAPLTSASALNACATGTPTLSINDVSTLEGASGTSTLTFTVSLTAPAGPGGVSFDIATADDTATAPGDYTATSLTGQTIPAGSSTYTFDVTILGDTVTEPDETFFVNVTNVTGAAAGDTQGQGLIQTDDVVDAAPAVLTFSPADGASNIPLNGNITVTFTEAVDVTPSSFSLSCSVSGTHAFALSGGPASYTLNPSADFVFGETCTVGVVGALVSDADSNDPPDTMAADAAASFGTPVPVGIHTIQGGGHLSPFNNQTVTTTQAVVTALRTVTGTRGYYVQDLSPDADDATSEGLFVFTGSTSNPASLVSVGDIVQVTGRVSEFRAGGASSRGLTITELIAPFTLYKLSSGNALPAPVVLGNGGRVIPTSVIEDDAANVETSGTFDPDQDGIDFWESLEGMLVTVNDPVVVGPTSDFTSNREIPVLADHGAAAAIRTARGGIVIRPTDFNPERIILNDLITNGATMPAADVGDSFPGAVTGVIDYSFNNPKLQVISLPSLAPGGLTPEVTTPATATQLAVATFNVENLAPSDPPAKFAALGAMVVQNLQSPDVLAIEEIQDNNGTTNNGTVDASTTWSLLIAAIQSAGGPLYDYRQIDPLNGADGGAPGGNIRQGFLFRTDRGVAFVDRPGATSATANAVVGSGASTQLQYSPGRIDPTNPAFSASRKPLAGEFTFRGQRFFVIANHFNSKGGDDPLYGFTQPPVLVTETQRQQQATVLAGFVGQLLAADPSANIVVLGDLNDFEFSAPMSTLKSVGLHVLMETLPQEERYSYVFEGNSQGLDHILVSGGIFGGRPFSYDVVHTNAEFAAQISDHDPQVVLITVNAAPTASAGGPYTVVEGGAVTLSATGSDPDGDALAYAWDLDGDGSFETTGQSVTFSAATLTAPGTRTVQVRVSDVAGAASIATATVDITYNFTGFYQPIDPLPVANRMTAGQAVPVRFSLGGDRGTQVLSSVSSVPVACPAGPSDVVENLSTAPRSNLILEGGFYIYIWKTDKAWEGQCRLLTLTTNDNVSHEALFIFRR